MLDPDLVHRFTDLAIAITVVAALVLVISYVSWKVRQTRSWQARERERMLRRITEASQDWPIERDRRHVNADLREAA